VGIVARFASGPCPPLPCPPMGILTWLKKRAATWGSTDMARHELAIERARVRTGAAKGRFTFLPYLDSLTGETQAHRNAYPQMLREPSVKAGILEKVLSIAALDVATNTTGDGPNDQEAAEFGLHLIGRIRATDWDVSGLPAFCETVVLPGLITGYSISEKTWHIEERGRWKGRLLLRLKSRMPGQQVDLEVDEHNNITAVIGRGASSGQRFEPHQFVIWRHLPLWDSPAGTSDLRAAYRAYFCIDTATKLRMIFLSKFAAGPMLKGTYADSGQRGELEDAMESAAANTWISIPDGVQVEMVDLAMKGTSDFKSAVDDFQQEVLLGISGATLQALQGDVANARGNSSVHKATADLRKWYISACVTSLLNTQVLTDATDLNFPAGTAVPEVSLGGVDDAEMAQSMTVDAGLSAMGVELSKEDLRKRYGRPEPTDEADTARPAGAGLGLGLPGAAPVAASPAPSVQQLSEPAALDMDGLAAAFFRAKAQFSEGDPDSPFVSEFCGGKGGKPGPCAGPEKPAAPRKPAAATKAEHRASKKIADQKIKDAPVPTKDQVVKARAELEAAKRGEIRAGGESRGGSAASRRQQRQNLFKEFGGEEKGYVVCPWTGIKMHWTDDPAINKDGLVKFERGKIFVKRQGGGYQLPNLIPESFAANRSRNDKLMRMENSR